jgi:hypothetical protein
VDVGAALVAEEQALEVVQPGQSCARSPSGSGRARSRARFGAGRSRGECRAREGGGGDWRGRSLGRRSAARSAGGAADRSPHIRHGVEEGISWCRSCGCVHASSRGCAIAPTRRRRGQTLSGAQVSVSLAPGEDHGLCSFSGDRRGPVRPAARPGPSRVLAYACSNLGTIASAWNRAAERLA